MRRRLTFLGLCLACVFVTTCSLMLPAAFAADPQVVGSCSLPGHAKGVAVAGDHAYVADSSGLRVVDVTDPTAPVVVGGCGMWDDSWSVALAGNYAYVADRAGGLQVVDVSDPTAPVVVGACGFPGWAVSVAVAGKYAYVGAVGSLEVVDVSNPTAPVVVGSCGLPGGADGVAVVGGYAYVGNEAGGLQVVDVSDPTAPVVAGSCAVPYGAWGVAVAGSYAYVGDAAGGLHVVDVTVPTAPVVVGSCSLPYGGAWSVVIVGSYAYVGDGAGGLLVVDVSRPSAPFVAGSCSLPGASGIALGGDHAYVAAGSMYVVHLGEPDTTAPQLQSFSFSPAFVSVDVAPATITFEARISDDLTGPARSGIPEGPSQVQFHSPSGNETLEAVFTRGENQVSGTGLDGTYRFTMTVPELAELGTWTVSSLRLVDNVGNVRQLSAAQLSTAGFPTSFEVAPGTAVQLTAAAKPAVVAYRGLVTVTGELRDGRGALLPGRTLVLQASSDGTNWSDFKSVESLTGVYSTTTRIERRTYFRWSFAGDETYVVGVSPSVLAKCRASLTPLAVPSIVRIGVKYMRYGYLRPQHAARQSAAHDLLLPLPLGELAAGGQREGLALGQCLGRHALRHPDADPVQACRQVAGAHDARGCRPRAHVLVLSRLRGALGARRSQSGGGGSRGPGRVEALGSAVRADRTRRRRVASVPWVPLHPPPSPPRHGWGGMLRLGGCLRLEQVEDPVGVRSDRRDVVEDPLRRSAVRHRRDPRREVELADTRSQPLRQQYRDGNDGYEHCDALHAFPLSDACPYRRSRREHELPPEIFCAAATLAEAFIRSGARDQMPVAPPLVTPDQHVGDRHDCRPHDAAAHEGQDRPDVVVFGRRRRPGVHAHKIGDDGHGHDQTGDIEPGVLAPPRREVTQRVDVEPRDHGQVRRDDGDDGYLPDHRRIGDLDERPQQQEGHRERRAGDHAQDRPQRGRAVDEAPVQPPCEHRRQEADQHERDRGVLGQIRQRRQDRARSGHQQAAVARQQRTRAHLESSSGCHDARPLHPSVGTASTRRAT